ncbi:hypothetical protein [Sphingomonas alpina]|uniref:Uncharacterized protein n=1 Tax=Sphingomonas alpina TaxID=653931 RepID=A0A7H0LKH9_9SPHN|nr:hypothetical protein [Sphingomonas alpina]QNQ10182.1 hypothetical protein H3Z74_02740 [Sphingomonas alpina]
MEQSERLNTTDTVGGGADERKSWRTPAVITPADIKEGTGFNAGVAGDNFLSSNASS